MTRAELTTAIHDAAITCVCLEAEAISLETRGEPYLARAAAERRRAILIQLHELVLELGRTHPRAGPGAPTTRPRSRATTPKP